MIMTETMLVTRPKPELVVPRPTPLMSHTIGAALPGSRSRTGARGRVGVKAGGQLPPLATAGPFPGVFNINLDDLEGDGEKPQQFIKVRFAAFLLNQRPA